MILVNPNVTNLAAGYALISDFMATLESTWLPGFERSYQRRTIEHQEALEKYENRGLFLRTLLKRPKQPNRPPLHYKDEVAARLHGDWTSSFSAEPPTNSPSLDSLHEIFDDNFYVVTGLPVNPDLTAPHVALGPPGIIVIGETENGRTNQPSQPPPKQIMQESAVAIRELLRPTEHADTPIHAGSISYWQQNLAGISGPDDLDLPGLFTLADTLLTHGQELSQAHTDSALSSAQKLTEREKDNLLRMAATL